MTGELNDLIQLSDAHGQRRRHQACELWCDLALDCRSDSHSAVVENDPEPRKLTQVGNEQVHVLMQCDEYGHRILLGYREERLEAALSERIDLALLWSRYDAHAQTAFLRTHICNQALELRVACVDPDEIPEAGWETGHCMTRK